MPDRSQLDDSNRLAAFKWLGEHAPLYDDVFPRDVLAAGFEFQGQRVPFLGPQGIFKPALCEFPLSITTTTNNPYADSEDDSGRLLYSYMGTDPDHWQNVGLRKAMERQIPLIYFKALLPGRYAASYPAYIVGDNPVNLMFTVVFGEAKALYKGSEAHEDELVRQYITRETKVRLHQKGFREVVLHAYDERCACCRLGHRKLLDAAHIIPDSDPLGEPVVSNGLSLCKIHHAAFDSYFLGIRPDYTVEVNRELLRERDGPMLQHGLQGMHGQKLIVPENAKLRPNPQHLEIRFDLFRKAG